MASMWRRPTWWQALAAAFAVGVLIAALVAWIAGWGDDEDEDVANPPEVVTERPPASVEIVFDPGGEARTARIQCDGTGNAQATGDWADDPQRACRSLYSAAPVLLGDPVSRNRDCRDLDTGAPAYVVTGRIGTDAVDRRFTRRDTCTAEEWQAARVLVDPWLSIVASPEAAEN